MTEPSVEETVDLLPARMLNEFAYCPRLFYLEYVQGEWRDSVDTLEGHSRHKHVEKERGNLPAPGDETCFDTIHARSVYLSAERPGLIAKIDLLEGEGNSVRPVDYKHGSKPNLPEGAYEPERIQICVQGIILQENGYRCDEGVLYFIASKDRVTVTLDETLKQRTLTLLADARRVIGSGKIPPPLLDSPKCPRCSLVGICLPDEVQYLADLTGQGKLVEVRRLLPARDDALPCYVQEQGASVSKKGETLEIKIKGTKCATAKLIEISQLCLYGNVSVTPPALHELCVRGIPVCHYSYAGWFYGITQGMTHKNVELRIRQFQIAGDVERSLEVARRIVEGKIRNCRTLLRRNHAGDPITALDEMARLAKLSSGVSEVSSLLGIEGAAANVYFSHFAGMLKCLDETHAPEFIFSTRNRRPPTDPVNSLLSFLYALLVKDVTVTLLSVGFDPYFGFYHKPKYGRPALALDLMEEFRPLVADSTVISLINTREISPKDFVRRGPAVALTPDGRKKVLQAYERRMDALVTHPVFGYSISYRRILEVQIRLLARHISGEIPVYEPFCTR
ncbi:MAG: CRISPR-associated endonuclease Cas1 [Methanoregula sp.]|nr:CRISPR-associated endonuclease Cas1 [Methanoregula sp.]